MRTTIRLALAAAALAAPIQLHAEVQITQHPTDQVVSLGAHVTLEVTASSTAPPITYQWYGKGALLPDQTSRTLVLNNIQLDQAGEYYVVVNDADNQPVESNPATVTVDPTFTKVAAGDIVTDQEGSVTGTWGDYDGDGFLDLYVANNSSSNVRNSLYRNNGNGTFTKQLTNAFLQTLGKSVSAAWADTDNDGDPDLIVARTYSGPTEWLRNDGAGQFTARQLTAASGPLCPVLADFDGDGWVDLFLSHVSGNDLLYRNNRDGAFRLLTAEEAGDAVLDGRLSAGAVAGDYDGDGDDDLWVGMEPANALYRNDGSSKFERVAPGSLATDTLGTTANWVDYDNDGWLDLSVAGINRPIALHRNLEGQGFADLADAAGLGVSIEAYDSAWGDYDNDGYIDFYFVNEYSRANTLYRNNGDGTFAEVDVGSPIRDGTNDVGVNWADIDNDGDLDLFIACGDGKPEANLLYLNNGNANHWLKVKLTGQASNRSGVGAKIRVQATIRGQPVTQLRQITACGLGAGHGLIAHFGLGDATQADIIRVEWPSGIMQELADVTANQALTVVEHQLYEGPAPAFASVTLSPSGVGLAVTEPATGALYVVEASADLMTWTKLMVGTSAGGTYEWMDEQPGNHLTRFYRLIVP
jgi:enediyne biosynthesis protein E4